MANINYIHGLQKVYGHVKVVGEERYEPAIYIINESSPRFGGMSFIVALSAMWKYISPFEKYAEEKLIDLDRKKFEETRQIDFQNRKDLDSGLGGIITREALLESNRRLAAIAFAEVLKKTNGILLMTGYNLAMCMQMFDIAPLPAAAAQLLMFIEDGLDTMKDMGPPLPDTLFNAGGYQVFFDGQKIGGGDWIVPESDVIEERYVHKPDFSVVN